MTSSEPMAGAVTEKVVVARRVDCSSDSSRVRRYSIAAPSSTHGSA